MTHNVVVETPYSNVITLLLDGKDISSDIYSADIKLRAGQVPHMTIKLNFRRLEMNDVEMDIEGLEDDDKLDADE